MSGSTSSGIGSEITSLATGAMADWFGLQQAKVADANASHANGTTYSTTPSGQLVNNTTQQPVVGASVMPSWVMPVGIGVVLLVVAVVMMKR